MIKQAVDFTHHGFRFTIEAEDWPSEGAEAAVIALQSWTLQLGPGQTAALHDALTQEREAFVHETAYDRAQEPLPALRAAQREAVRSGLGNHRGNGDTPSITLEAAQTFEG